MSQEPSPKILETDLLCQHCQINPKATKPYIKRIDLPLDDLTEKVLKAETEKTGLPKECLVCLTIKRFFKMSKKNQLELLKNEYEWRKKHGFA
jgi:hypothetical protein